LAQAKKNKKVPVVVDGDAAAVMSAAANKLTKHLYT